MITDMKRVYIITFLSSFLVVSVLFGINEMLGDKDADATVKVGFVYQGDASTSHTNNFVKAQEAVENQYAGRVNVLSKYNVSEESVGGALEELVEDGCELIFTTSYGYGQKAKEYAGKYPDVEFCQAGCSNADEEPVLSNYHTFMGKIYQGRYISGVVAGIKLKELLDVGAITQAEAKVGYIGVYPSAEVISGYTAFFLGVRSVVPKATMTVRYTIASGNYRLEKKYAREMIDEGCVILSQHTDTSAPAEACEETERTKVVYYVSYNESMADIAPTTYLTGTKINWKAYITEAVGAVISGRDIESCVKGVVNGNDVGAGFENDWVRMLDVNKFTAAPGTEERVEELVRGFKRNEIKVFQGDYIGVNPENPSDTIDLREGFEENKTSSAPTFHYVLKDVITVK